MRHHFIGSDVSLSAAIGFADGGSCQQLVDQPRAAANVRRVTQVASMPDCLCSGGSPACIWAWLSRRATSACQP